MVDRQTVESSNWLAETKFHPPLLREDIIPRPHLLETLRSSLASYPLTLLSAPAGYGKSTLLAALLPTYTDLSLVWLSLDEEENDPIRFLKALIASLQHLNPTCGLTALTLLTDQALQGVEMRRVTSVLINEMLETIQDPFAVILDDLHRITEPGIFAALDYLLEHRPPQLHLVVATRIDPPLSLARLRARGELAELRFNEMRFKNEDTTAFLNDRLKLGLSADELAMLQSRTEGWAVGLRLLASSLDKIHSSEDRRTFIDNLAQTDHNIFEFLAEEVFLHEEVDVQTFLLETSILNELTPSNCKAVTHRSDSESLLESLYRRNLFLVQISPFRRISTSESRNTYLNRQPLEPNNNTPERQYRYHDLFAEFLQHKLEEEFGELVSELHLRAALAESDPARVVGHYLAAAKWQEAADLVEQYGLEMFNRGFLDNLSGWIVALPASVREGRPRLLHFQSHCVFLKGDWEKALELLERALQGFEATGDKTGQGVVLTDLATCASGLGDLEWSGELFSQALNYPIPSHTRVQALLGRALVNGTRGDWEQTEQDFNAAMSIVQQSSELDPLYLVMLPFFHPDFAFLPGGLEHLERFTRQANDLLGDRVSPSRLMVEEMRTVLHLFRGQLTEAIRIGEQAQALREQLGGHPYNSLNAARFLMIAHAARGDYAAVEPLFDRLFQGIDLSEKPSPDLPIYLFYAGRVRWLQGRFKEAGEIYSQICALRDAMPEWEIPEGRICRLWMKSLLEMTEGHYREAEQILCKPEVLEQKDRGSTVHGNTRLMLARLYWQQDRSTEALAELKSVLASYEQLGIPFAILLEGQSIVPLLQMAVERGIHVNYAADLLEILGANKKPQPVEVPTTGETLTTREVEVLKQIVQGVNNRTIAERLVITESTVKTHVSHIFTKLNVSTRSEAAARTRELMLL